MCSEGEMKMRNMFIVSFDSRKDENAPSAKGIQLALEKQWGYGSGVRFNVEEGGHREIAKLVSDYLDAEEALEKFDSATPATSLDTEFGIEWKARYDNVREKRTTLVGKLREYGAMV